MASPIKPRELRILSGITHNTEFTNAASSSWNVADNTAIKLKAVSYDGSGLTQEGLDDETLQSRLFSTPSKVPGLRKGNFSFSTYMTGAYSNVTATEELNLLRDAMGGVQNPTTTRSHVAEGGGSVINVPLSSANSYCVAGQALLCGTKADGRGNGEVKVIHSVDANSIVLGTQLNSALSAGDAIVISSTAFLDEDAGQRYIDSVVVGHGTADQQATIGGVPKPTFSGMTPGELPKIDWEVDVTDWKWIPPNERTSLTPARSPRGGNPAQNKGIGMIQIADNGSNARHVFKGAELTVAPNTTYEEIPDLSGVNGIGGFQKQAGTPTFEFTALVDEDFGLVADFEDSTAKSLMFQMGHTATKCCAIEMQKAYLDSAPQPTALGNLQGMKIMGHGTESYIASNDLNSAALKVHQF
jgi:hypothetical protein